MTERPGKPWRSIEEQAALLKVRGLLDADNFLAELRRIGYYRLSGYSYVFRRIDSDNKKWRRDEFYPEVSFAQILDLYEYDRRLRLAVFESISRCEIAIRTAIGHIIGEHHPYAHLDGIGLRDELPDGEFRRFSKSYDTALRKSREDFVAHHSRLYGGRLPIWAATEIMDFGALVHLYEFAQYSDRKRMAEGFNARADEFQSWLKAINIVRNICAHHGRLWNRNIVIKPSLKHRTSDSDPLKHAAISTDRLYGVLAVISYLLNSIGGNEQKLALKSTLSAIPSIQGIALAMTGAPENWATNRLWGSSAEEEVSP